MEIMDAEQFTDFLDIHFAGGGRDKFVQKIKDRDYLMQHGKLGMVVSLKSGGPKMVINNVEGDKVNVSFFTEDGIFTELKGLLFSCLKEIE